ncbi:MAG: site-2 protease family protein [Planctomycetota bacterium]|nr:site-2 protease family protein [Planctomycetota bacterium]
MYRDSFTEPGWVRALRWLAASFPVGRFFGVRVRMLWIAAILLPLILLRNVEGLPFVEGLTYIALTMLALFTVIWTHEMGHIVAGRRYGIQTPLITLSPMGGVAHMSAGAPSPRKEMIIALAGPAVHLIWLVPVVPLALLLEYGDLRPGTWLTDPGVDLVDTLLYINLALLAFNLLPFFPMDGGRVLRGFLATKMHPNAATMRATKIGMVGGWLFIVVGIAGVFGIIFSENLWGWILVAIGVSNLMACKQERVAAQYSAGPYATSEPRQPWESDPDAWKSAAAEPDEDTGRRAEKRAAKEARRLEREAEAREALDAEVDRVLDRVNEVGLDGLTAKERKILDRAAKRRRGE